MSDVADHFPQLAALSFDQLNARRAELLGNAKSFEELSVDKLQELSAVANLLRRKASGPPRDEKAAKATPKVKSILDLNV